MSDQQVPARYAVFGHPVAHSLSPRIHAAFARADWRGDQLRGRRRRRRTNFAAALAAFAATGGKGANITLPHKQAALALCAKLSDRARSAGAVNTLCATRRLARRQHRRRRPGARPDRSQRAGPARARTLLLGAGGAAHGVAPALLEAGIGDLFIVNRHPERADALADTLGQPGRVHLALLGRPGQRWALSISSSMPRRPVARRSSIVAALRHRRAAHAWRST